jgi:hypothetical protein
MIKVGVGQSESIDTRHAVQAVIAECKRQLQGYAPEAGIVFASVNFDHQQMLNEIHRSFPKILCRYSCEAACPCGNRLNSKALCRENKFLWPGFCILVGMARAPFMREATPGWAADRM